MAWSSAMFNATAVSLALVCVGYAFIRLVMFLLIEVSVKPLMTRLLSFISISSSWFGWFGSLLVLFSPGPSCWQCSHKISLVVVNAGILFIAFPLGTPEHSTNRCIKLGTIQFTWLVVFAVAAVFACWYIWVCGQLIRGWQ